MADPRWLDEREARAWRQFVFMMNRLRSYMASELQRETGLSDSDYEVLVNLSEAPHDRLRPSELSSAIRWEKSRLSHHLTRMEQRGLVKRAPCQTDSRGAFVGLPAAGRRVLEKAPPRHVEQVRRVVIDALTPAQLDALAEISEVVLAKLAECPSEPD